MSPTLTWVPGTYSAARRDDVLDPITADILHVDGTPTRWAVQIEHDPKGVTDIGDVFFGGMRLPFVAPRGRAPGRDCAADLIAKHAAAARAIAEAIIAKAGLLGTDDAVEIVKRMEATWPDLDRAVYLDFVRAADPSPPDGYIPAPVGCDDDEDDDWGDGDSAELVAALNLCTTLRDERDAALAEADRLRAVIAEAAEGLRNRPGGAFWSPARAEAVAVRQAQPRADRWRLISDTTPRDGSRIMLWYPPIRIEDGVAAEGFWSSQYAGDWMPSRGSAALGRHERRPTHWMPLPQGPALGGGR